MDMLRGATVLTAILMATPVWAGTTELISVSLSGVPAGGEVPSISADGRFVTFNSTATYLVPIDANSFELNVFIRDRQALTTELISVSSSGVQGNGLSGGSSLSSDARFVAFISDATNLVPGDTNGKRDVFVRDRLTKKTARASVSSSGVQGNKGSYYPAISANGRYVTFTSEATNLVKGDTNKAWDVFVRDLETGTTQRVSVSSTGAQGKGYSHTGSISSNGRYVAFWSSASNLVPNDTNKVQDVFVRDLSTKKTMRVSVSSGGGQGNGASVWAWITGDGHYIVFDSDATNLVAGDTNDIGDVFIRDLTTKATKRVSLTSTGAQTTSGGFNTIGNSQGSRSLTQDGRYVAFTSHAYDLVPEDSGRFSDIFVRDLVAGVTSRSSVSSTGAEGDDFSFGAVISGDGSVVAFTSAATNLAPNDTNEVWDVFVRTR
jgi:hypothetical protein